MADSKDLEVRALARASNFECEALRAVLEFFRGEKVASVQKLIRVRNRQPLERSTCERLVEVAVRQGANVYVTDKGTIDQLREVLDQGVPVIVAMSSPCGGREQSHFAIVVGIDATEISLMYPEPIDKNQVWANDDAKEGPPLEVRRLARAEFAQRWHWIDGGLGATTVDAWYMVAHFDGGELAAVNSRGRDATPPDRRRKPAILIAAWSIFIIEVVLACFAYSEPGDFIPPMIALALALIGFTLIDFFARPEKRKYASTLVPRWYRAYLPFWCVVPFITAVGGSTWVHFQKWTDARGEVRQLAEEVKAAVEWPDYKKPDDKPPAASPSRPADNSSFADAGENPIVDVVTTRGWFSEDEATDRCWKAANTRNEHETLFLQSDVLPVEGWSDPHLAIFRIVPPAERKHIARYLAAQRTWRCFTMERVTAKVAAIVSSRYRDDKDKDSVDEAKRFAEIARVVGHDVLTAHGDIDVVCNDIRVDTGSGLILAIAIQALFIFWVPALLAVSISRALKRTRRVHTREEVQRSMDLRDFKIIAEDEYLFLPRICFAILLVLGTNYVFAPLGLKASYIMSIVDEHALPGHTTFTLWSTSFSQAPVIVVGFVGFLLYALITATQRFALDDFDDRALLALLVRGLVVILLSFALSSSEINEFASRTFVFIAGVFPVRALEAIAKRVNVAIDPDFTGDQDPSFAGLPGLDPVKVFALRAAGIQSTYDLAAMNIQDVAERVRIDPRLLGRAVDRAILIDALGLKLTERLSEYGITAATELVDAGTLTTLSTPAPTSPGDVAVDPTTLRGAAEAVQARLSKDERVKSVRGWLARRDG